MTQYAKKTSASISTTISLILVISTVIVFTVLLFLSFENMVNNSINNTRAEASRYSKMLAGSMVGFFDERTLKKDGNEIDNAKTIRALVGSAAQQSGGLVMVANGFGEVLWCANPVDGFRAHLMDVIKNDLPKSIPVGDGRSLFASSAKVSGSNVYCISALYYDRADTINEFETVILYPAIVAVGLAVILFVLAIQLSFSPVRDMSKVISKVSEGDFSVRVNSKYTDNATFGQIAASGDIVTMANTLNDMINQLENMENDRQIFISSVAHDIRTPLTSINGFVTAILDGTIPPENYEKYLLLVKQEVNRIRSLVVSMTEASSLSHVDPDVMEEFPIGDVITDIVSNLEPQFKEKEIECEVRLSQDSKAKMCYGESQQLCRVIVNIITNAIKFTPVSGKILVTTMPVKGEHRVQISVEDSGIGIPKEKRSRIFESFYKVDSSRTKEGFGLGLYICKQILQGHGQSITVDESEELGGAKFIFTFPIPPEAQ